MLLGLGGLSKVLITLVAERNQAIWKSSGRRVVMKHALLGFGKNMLCSGCQLRMDVEIYERT